MSNVSGHFQCTKCKSTDGVGHGNCSRCGDVKTIPVSPQAKAQYGDKEEVHEEKEEVKEEAKAPSADEEVQKPITKPKRNVLGRITGQNK